jgi:hypothetical protein
MTAPNLRTYRVALVGSGAYAIWVTAESRRTACELAERMWRESRFALSCHGGGIGHIEILDEYEEADAA